jgi:flagellar secretion chaperone FliS
MNHNPSDSYLVDQIMTSTPQKLQLMLLDAAIREGELARKHWQPQENRQAEKCLLRALRIMYCLLGGIDLESKSELVCKVASVYLFISQAFTRAYVDSDANKLAEALRVLAIERETWRQLCEQLATSSGDNPRHDTGHPPIMPKILSNDEALFDQPHTSFSLEA